MRTFLLALTFAIAALSSPGPAAAKPAVLLVLAHPDDETCAGGTLGRLKELGVSVHALYVTRGEGGKRVVMTKAGPVSKEIDDKELRQIRAGELKEAARRFGFKSFHVLGERDRPLRTAGKPTRDVVRFLKAKIWRVKRIERAIEALAKKVQPAVVLTMFPRHDKIHAHHQAVGSIVLRLFKSGRLGPRAQQAYGILERDWYPGVFRPNERDVHWARSRRSKKLGMTYGEFFAHGSAAHQSQLPGHIKRIKPKALETVELLRPLTRPRRRKCPLRRLLAGK